MVDRSAIIRAASLKSVQERFRLNAQAREELQALYLRVADHLAAQAANMTDASGRVPLDQLQRLLTQTQGQISKMGEQRNGMLYRYLDKAADLGVNPFTGYVQTDALFATKHQAVAFVKSLVGNDGLQLSERLWRLDQGATQAVSEQIQAAIIRGDSAHQVAAAALSRGQPVPDGTQAALDAANGQQIGRSIRHLMTGAPDPYTGRGVVWQAERVFRTEINRAHGEAYMSAAEDTDGVAGIRFNLSPRHPRQDVCDEHASADLYGLGPGVYPNRAACPWPAHPNTFSYVTAVFDDELPTAKKPDEKTPPPVPVESATPQTLDQFIDRGRQHGERLLLGQDNATFLERLHNDLVDKRGAGAAVAQVGNGGAGAKLVQMASRMYPKTWVKKTDAMGPLFARKTSGRGWHCTLTENRPTVAISQFGLIRDAKRGMGWIAAGNFRTAVHEYTHRLQSAMPGLDDIFQSLHQRRTAGMPLKKLRDLTGIRTYAASEVAREDHYTNPYQGKIYTPHASSYVGQYGALEVMTMAFDSVLGNDLSRLTAMLEADREMIELVLGVLYHYDP